jgi:hypothetical protein
VLIGELLNLIEPILLGVFRNRLVLEHLLQVVVCVAADVVDPVCVPRLPRERPSASVYALFGERRNRHPNQLAVI